MFAIIRELYYDVTKLAEASEQLEELQRLHKAQPGYLGNLTVEVGPGRQVVINLWQTEAQASAGREALEPSVRQFLGPLMAAPSQMIGAGSVVNNDFIDVGKINPHL